MLNYGLGSGIYMGKRTNTNLYGEKPLSYNRTRPKVTTQKLKNNQRKKTLRTVALVAATAVLAYKGAPVISKVVTAAGVGMRKFGAKVATKCPNLAKAGEYFIKACKAPLKPIDKLVQMVTKKS